MKKKLTALIAFSAVFAFSAVSCGKDEPSESSVPDFPELSASESEDNTEAVTEADSESATEEDKKESSETTSAETKAVPETTEKSSKTENKDTSDKSENSESPKDSEDSDESTPDEPENNAQHNDNPEDSTPDELSSEPDPEPVTDSPAEPPQQIQSLIFSENMLNGDAASVVFELGGDPDISTAPACFANGADSKTYTYDGLVLQCYVLEGSEYIYAFTITGAGYTSEHGIAVGSSRSDVELYYGAGEASGNDVMYIYDNYDMTITYDGDTVTAIDFYAPV